jgi:hypothetical protein
VTGHVRELLGQPLATFIETVKLMMKAGDDLGWEELRIKAARFRTAESREPNAIISTAGILVLA